MPTPQVGQIIRIIMSPTYAKHLGNQRRLVGKVTAVNAKTVTIEGRGELMQGGEGGICWACGQRLTNPASVQIGVGPDCAKQIGISWLGSVRDRELTAEELARAKQDMAVVRTLPLLGIGWGLITDPAPMLASEMPRPTSNNRALDSMPPILPAPTELVPLDVSLPDGYSFFPYQEIGVRTWMTTKDLILADEQGLGKSLQVIGAIQQMRYAYRDDMHWRGYKRMPSVIVCPKSLKHNWLSEFRRFAPDLRIQVLDGRKDKLLKNQDVYISHYESLATGKSKDGTVVLSVTGKALDKLPKLALAIDEAHKIKDANSLRSMAVAQLAMNARHRALLSGTAILARPRELIPQIKILGKMEELFASTSAFRVRFCNLTLRRLGKRRIWDDSGCSNLAELHDRLAPIMLRRLKKDVLLDLPEKRYARVVVELENDSAYRRLEEEVADADPALRAAMMARLRRLLADGKTQPAVDWVESFVDSTEGEKLVVFAHHRETQQRIADAFPGCARIMASADMQRLKLDVEMEKQRFMIDPECRLIVCSLMAAGVGHTLTAASNLLFVELSFTPGDMDQAADRIHRISQRESCTIWTLVAEDSVDDRLTEILVEKRQITGIVLDGEEQVLNEQTVTRAAIVDILRRVRDRKKRAV